MSTSITFQCANCGNDFELEILHLLERPGALKCSHCGSRPSPHRAQQLATALEDMLTVMGALAPKVNFELQLDSEALPPPYSRDSDDGSGGLGRLDDDDDDDDDDVDDDDDGLNELSFDDDDFDESDDDFDEDEEEEEEEFR